MLLPENEDAPLLEQRGAEDLGKPQRQNSKLLRQWQLLGAASRDTRLNRTTLAVLWSLLERSNDDGVSWPKLETIAEDAAINRASAVRGIKLLVALGYIERQSGGPRRSNRYRLIGAELHRCKAAPMQSRAVRRCKAAPSDGADLHPESSSKNQLKEPSQKREPRERGHHLPDRPPDVDQQVWADWLQLRKAKKAPVTETVLQNAKSEATKAGLTLTGFLSVWCLRGSQGLQADWLKPHERARTGPPVNASFKHTVYEDSDELPDWLQPKLEKAP